MDRLAAGVLGRRDQLGNGEIGFGRRRGAEQDRGVGVTDVRGEAGRLGGDRDGRQTFLLAGADHANRDFAAVRDQHPLQRHPTSDDSPKVSNALHSAPTFVAARRYSAVTGAVHVACSSTASFSAAKTKSCAGTRSAFVSFPVTQTSGRLFHLTARSSGGRSNAMLAHTARDWLSARSDGSRVRSSRSTRLRSTLSPRQRSTGMIIRSGLRPRANRRYHAACVSVSPAVKSIPWCGQARSRFSPSSSSRGGRRSSSGSACQVSVAAVVPAASQSTYAHSPNAYTRYTRAESAVRVPALKRAARSNAICAVSSVACAHTVSTVIGFLCA